MIRINSITARAFRGIPTELELDLTAAITLVYAPNGTGKTTICDAAEWLLTGQLRRLDLLSPDEIDLRCQFAQRSLETGVSGKLTVNGKPLFIERTLDGARVGTTDKNKKTMQISKLLTQLAPTAVEPESQPIHATSSRQIWLRATRFLSYESLALLLESDEKTVSAREKVFADLLGVGHLFETERQLEGYSTQMRDYVKAQRGRVNEKAIAIQDREARLRAALGEVSSDITAHVFEVLEKVRQRLDPLNTPPLQKKEDITYLRDAASALRAALKRQKAELEEKSRAEIDLVSVWADRANFERSLQSDQHALSQNAQEQSDSQTKLDLATRAALALQAEVREIQRSVQVLKVRANSVSRASEYVHVYLREYLDISKGEEPTLSQMEALVHALGPEASRRVRSKALKDLLDDLPRISAEREELVAIEENLKRFNPQTFAESVIATASRDHDKKQESASLAREVYIRTSGPIEQLRMLAGDVANWLGSSTHCPVCSHDWGSHSALCDALVETAKATPEALKALDRLRENAELQADEARKQLGALESQAKEYGGLLKRSRVLHQSRLQADARISELGLSAVKDPLELRVKVELARLSLADGVARLLLELAEARNEAGVEIAASFPLSRIPAEFEDISKRRLNEIQVNLAVKEAEAKIAIGTQSALSRTIVNLKSDQAGLERRAALAAGQLQKLRLAWSKLSAQEEWSDEAFEKYRRELRERHAVLSDLERRLDEADANLERANLETEIARTKGELEPLNRELKRLEGLMMAAASVQAAYVEKRNRHATEQMANIVNVISPLFSRMQANEVYDGIRSGNERAPLSWSAYADDVALNPEKKFSQGQRHDFALSIFLARARGLKGTFFLDEPVAHLDDLNRVALLDIFRVIANEAGRDLSLVITTASSALVRHMIEKFKRLDGAPSDGSLLRVVELRGNARVGVERSVLAELGGIR